MIPANLYNPRLVEDLKWYLIQELRQTMSDRNILENQWVLWEEIYRARPAAATKDFPFIGASNLVIPAAATDIDTLYSRLMGMLFDQPGLWAAQAQRPELVDFAEGVTEFLKWAQENEIKPYREVGNWLLEVFKLGTGVLKQRYVREMKKAFEWRETATNQAWQQQAIVMLQDHPGLNHVRLHDFFIPAGFPLIQQAPWVSERIRLTWQQFMARVKAGIYFGADQVGSFFYNPPRNNVQQSLDMISDYRASRNKLMEFYEFWLDYDIDGDGWDESVVCTIHLASQTYVRIDLNPWFNQDKPYTASNMMRDVNSFYGIGMCEMMDHFQEEITAMHNQRIDSGTVGNSAMYAVRRDNMNIRENEPVYPSKVWRVNNPKEDIVRLPLGTADVTSASIQMEEYTRGESRARTGVNDYINATPSPATSYGTAYTTQQMLLNSSKRLGETVREVGNGLGESGTRIMELYQQFWPNGKPFVALGQQDGALVDVILKMPLDLIRKGIKITVNAIDATNSKDAQIRTTTLVFQSLQQFYMNYMQMLSYAANPSMPHAIQQVALQAAEGSAVLMKRLLQLYDVQDYSRMLPDLTGGVNAQQQAQANIAAILRSATLGQSSSPAGQSSGPQFGGNGAPGGSQAPYGMASLSQSPGNPQGGLGTGSSDARQLGIPLPGAGQNIGLFPGVTSAR